jgi:hypothetical protein
LEDFKVLTTGTAAKTEVPLISNNKVTATLKSANIKILVLPKIIIFK